MTLTANYHVDDDTQIECDVLTHHDDTLDFVTIDLRDDGGQRLAIFLSDINDVERLQDVLADAHTAFRAARDAALDVRRLLDSANVVEIGE